MIKLYDSGVYLLHGSEIVENAEEAGAVPDRRYPVRMRRRIRWLTGFWRRIILPGTWKSFRSNLIS